MADYKELLRKAIDGLPENNGAARRAVYEKARGALVNQLRAIKPPLAPREINQHRLNLEDCIRLVEQEATEALLRGRRAALPPPDPAPEPEPEEAPAPRKAATNGTGNGTGKTRKKRQEPAPAASSYDAEYDSEIVYTEDQLQVVTGSDAGANEDDDDYVEPQPELERPRSRKRTLGADADRPIAGRTAELAAATALRQSVHEPGTDAAGRARRSSRQTIEEVIAAAERETAYQRGGDPESNYDDDRYDGDGYDEDDALAEFQAALMPVRGPATARNLSPRNSQREVAAMRKTGSRPAARPKSAEPAPIADEDLDEDEVSLLGGEALESSEDDNPQAAIDRAIAALDRAASGEEDEDDLELAEEEFSRETRQRDRRAIEDDYFEDEDDEDEEEPAPPPPPRRRKRSQEDGRLKRPRRLAEEPDFDNVPVLGSPRRSPPARPIHMRDEFEPAPRNRRELPEMNTGRRKRGGGLGGKIATGLIAVAVLLLMGGGTYWAWQQGLFGGGEPPVEQVADAVVDEPATDVEAPAPQTPVRTVGPVQTPGASERLPGDTAPQTPPQTADAGLPAGDEQLPSSAPEQVVATSGGQSILFEEQGGGQGPAPFSGGVEWSRAADEIGLPVIKARSTIPARNMTVDLLIRKNSDPGLPASHLMEVNFTVTQTFVGGGIGGMPGVLLKAEERAQDEALVGASARVKDNSFLFALSTENDDIARNLSMLKDYKWLDLPLVYSTGRRAIITLEKGEEGQAIFEEVLAEWAAQ